MRRHGWAFCLGLFLTGAATAQPPADEDRFPPPPDLPGQVIAQTPGLKTADSDKPKDDKPATLPDLQPAETTAPAPAMPTEPPAPAVAPAAGLLPPPSAAPCPPAAQIARKGHDIGFAEIANWLLFRSHARQSGCYPPPYVPPLYAWFPCEPGKGPCCIGGIPGKPAWLPAAPAVPLTVAVKPVPPTAGNGELPPPGTAIGSELPLGGGMAIGTCAPPLTPFEQIGVGLGFTPGGAPMANPTRQIAPSSWRPR
jgi:hypothetical protein